MVDGAICFDDLVQWFSEEYINYRGLYARDVQQGRCIESQIWLISVNTTKTIYTVFSLSTKKQEAKLKMNGQFLAEDPFPTYLGVNFDHRLTWKQQINKCCSRAKMRLAIMKKLAGTDWGADQRILKKLHRQS